MQDTGRFKIATGAGHSMWPALVLIVAAVLVPTVCVLWFMNKAMSNERIAVRQRLTAIYERELARATRHVDAWVADKLKSLATPGADAEPSATFAQLVRSGQFDSAVVLDDNGAAVYPCSAEPTPTEGDETPEWNTAQTLEFQRKDWTLALQAYQQLETESTDSHVQARALLAQARCLHRLDRTDEAAAILIDALADPPYDATLDRHGRLIRPSGLLLALRMIDDGQSPRHAAALAMLAERLNDYTQGTMPASQRRFLMRHVRKIAGDPNMFPAMAAEELAWQYVSKRTTTPISDRLASTPVRDLWQLTGAGGRHIGLLRRERVTAEVQNLLRPSLNFDGLTARFMLPETDTDQPEPFLSTPSGQSAPGWILVLTIDRPDPFTAAADEQIALYWWTGLLSIAAIAAMALAAGRLIQRQMRLARLKNDLIATVSHELKTPLASMRVLVDTLLAGRCKNEKQADEYLKLIATENERLSRLIDNFLAFSRMERNKHAFEHDLLDVRKIVSVAVASVQERFESNSCTLNTDVAHGLPPVRGDHGALVTVLLNLLDNAYKYTGDDKHITLRAHADKAGVCIEVADNGIGIPARAQKRIFDRFCQLDQRLARDVGGCGLGLSIVKFIVTAHDGTISVRSEMGKGSTFSVTLPAG